MTDSVEPTNARERTTGELLSLVAGSPVKDVPDLSALSRMTTAEMANRLGIDRKGAQTIQAALELAHRTRTLERNALQFPDDLSVSAWFRERLGDHRKESFWALTLDQKHKIIDCHRISEGTLSMVPVHPREAFNPVLRDAAAAVIFVHNHPSGDPAPSWGDHVLTHRLSECGDLLGIRVLDHLVVGSERHYSFYDHGKLGNDYGSQAAEIDREKPSVSVKREVEGRKSKEVSERPSEITEFVVPKKEPTRQRNRFRDDGRGR